MPRYKVRRYYTYVDEFEVEADDEQEADDKVSAATNISGHPIPDNPQGVIQTAENEYVCYTDTEVVETDEHGAWLTEPVEL